VETSTAEDEDDVIVEFEGVSDIDTDATAEDEYEDADDVAVEFEANTDTDAPAADEDELIVKLKAVSDAEEEPEAVAEMALALALALKLPSVEPLELYMDSMLEELEVGRSVNEDEPDRPSFDEADVELPTLLEDVEPLMLLGDDVEVERVLLDELDEIMLDLDLSLLVEDARLRLEDGV
jgi:hypothetical protein